MTKNAWRAEPLVGDVTMTVAEFKLEKDKSTCSASFFSSASIDSNRSEQDRLNPPINDFYHFCVSRPTRFARDTGVSAVVSITCEVEDSSSIVHAWRPIFHGRLVLMRMQTYVPLLFIE